VQHNKLGTKSYTFAPFLAYMVRIAKSAAARIVSSRFISEPEAPLGEQWLTQDIELGDPWGYATQVEVEVATSGAASLNWYVDGALVNPVPLVLASTGSTEVFQRRRVVLPLRKGKLGRIELLKVGGCRVRWKGTTAWIISWGSAGRWVNVAGAEHRESGAKV
jgi:hypothetical protein